MLARALSRSALRLIRLTAAVVLGVPCFFSDGFSSYLPALIAVYHQIKEFARTGKGGRPRNPVVEPQPELVYAQLVKQKKKGRLKSLTERVCCGAAGHLGTEDQRQFDRAFQPDFATCFSPLNAEVFGVL